VGGWGFRSDPGFALAGGPGAGAWPAAAMDRAELTTEQVSAWDCLLTRLPNLFQLRLLMPVSFIHCAWFLQSLQSSGGVRVSLVGRIMRL